MSMMIPLVPVASGAVVWPLLAPWDVQVRAFVPPARWPVGFQVKTFRVPPTARRLPAAPSLIPVPLAVKLLPEV